MKYLQRSRLPNRVAAIELRVRPRRVPRGASLLRGNQFLRRAPGLRVRVYSEFSPAVSASLAVFGTRGLYVVPALASLGTRFLTYVGRVESSARRGWSRAWSRLSHALYASICGRTHWRDAPHRRRLVFVAERPLSAVRLPPPICARPAIVVRDELYCLRWDAPRPRMVERHGACRPACDAGERVSPSFLTLR